MNTPSASFRARRRLRTLAGLFLLAPAVCLFAQSGQSGGSGQSGASGQAGADAGGSSATSGTGSGSGTQSGSATGTTSGEARAEAMAPEDARARALAPNAARADAMEAGDARADAMTPGDARADAMGRQGDARSRAMTEGDARTRAMRENEARAEAMGADGAEAGRRADGRSAADGDAAVSDLPRGVTSGGGSVVTGGATRRATTEGAVLGDGMRLNDGSMSIDDQAQGRRDPATTARMIGETGFAYRDRAMTMAERELNESATFESSLKRASMNVSGLARGDMNDAIKEVDAARTEFAKAISKARSANESRWEDSREEVVERYNDYVKAQEQALETANKAGATVDEPGRLPAPPVLR